MSPIQQIYFAILDKFDDRSDVNVLRSSYFPEIFGNFIISFRIQKLDRSLVNERFQLFLCTELGGEGDRKSIIRDIRRQTPAEVVERVESSI